MTFRLKITLCMVGLLSVLFGIGGSLLVALSFQSSLEQEQEAAYGAYQMVIGTLTVVDDVNGSLSDDDIARTLKQLTEQNRNGWTFLRLATAENTLYEHGASLHSRHFGTYPEAGTCTIRYETPASGEHAVVLSGALETSGETLYLDMTRDVSALIEARDAQQQTFQQVFLLMVVLCALLSYTVARVLTAPLVDLSRTSRSIAAGRLSSRANIASRDEIGRVARDFNEMADALESTIAELEDAAERQNLFTGSFAHEVKTPMTSIIGYADLIQKQALEPDELTEAARYIFTEGKRLESLSGKLLDLLVLHGQSIALAPASPASIVEELTGRLAPIYAEQGIALVCECEEGTCLLEADLVASLLVNLCDNARKAMDEAGGTLSVRVAMAPDGCRIAIGDTGRGIPPEALAHLTEAFYRVDKSRSRSQGGVGLGLALCREIVALHNGSMRFAGSVGKGTIVTVWLKGGAA